MSLDAMPLRLLFGGDVMLGRLAGEALLREGADYPLAAQALRDAGIGLLSLANKHILDYGVPGLLETLRLLAAGVRWPILYAAGDLVDDYAVDPGFRNDHQLLFALELGEEALERVVMHPLFIRHGRVFPANSAQRAWILERMRERCAELGTATATDGDTLTIKNGPAGPLVA